MLFNLESLLGVSITLAITAGTIAWYDYQTDLLEHGATSAYTQDSQRGVTFAETKQLSDIEPVTFETSVLAEGSFRSDGVFEVSTNAVNHTDLALANLTIR